MSTQSKIEPPTVEALDGHAKAKLSFGPEAIIVPTPEHDGFTIMVVRDGVGPFTVPVLWVRVRFDAQLNPVLEGIKTELVQT